MNSYQSDNVIVMADLAMELPNDVAVFKRYIADIAMRTKPKNTRKRYAHLYDEIVGYLKLFDPKIQYIEIDELGDIEKQKNDVVKRHLHLLRPDKSSATPHKRFCAFFTWMVENYLDDAKLFYNDFSINWSTYFKRHSTSNSVKKIQNKALPHFSDLLAEVKSDLSVASELSFHHTEKIENDIADIDSKRDLKLEQSESVATIIHSDKSPVSTIKIIDKIVSPWVVPQALPKPKVNEAWETLPVVALPPTYGIRSAPTHIVHNYYPEAAIWSKDEIRILAFNRKDNRHSQLFSVHSTGGPAHRVFYKRPKGNFIKTRHMRAIRTESSHFLISDCWGLTVIEPDDEPGWASHMAYGQFQYLSPELKSISGVLEGSNKLPFETFISDYKWGSSYSSEQTGVAISKSGKILHSSYTTSNEGALGTEGEKIILWQQKDGDHSKYEAEVVYEPKGKYLIVPIWSPTENYVFFEDRTVLCLSTKSIFKLGENQEQVEKSWHLVSRLDYATWHPTADIIALVGAKKFEQDKFLYRLELWDVANNERITSKSLDKVDWISCIDWSPDGTKIAFSNSPHTVTIWDIEADEVRTTFVKEPSVTNLYFSPDAQRLAVQTCENRKRGKAYIFSSTVEVLISFRGDISVFKESPWQEKGRHIAYRNGNNIEIRKLEF